MRTEKWMHSHVWNITSLTTKKMIVYTIIILLIGIFVGTLIGTAITIKSIAEIGSGFLDKELIENALYQYNNQLKGCYPSVI